MQGLIARSVHLLFELSIQKFKVCVFILSSCTTPILFSEILQMTWKKIILCKCGSWCESAVPKVACVIFCAETKARQTEYW